MSEGRNPGYFLEETLWNLANEEWHPAVSKTGVGFPSFTRLGWAPTAQIASRTILNHGQSEWPKAGVGLLATGRPFIGTFNECMRNQH